MEGRVVEKRYSNGRYKKTRVLRGGHSGWHRGGTEAGGWDGWLERGEPGKQPPSTVARRKRGENGERE